MLLLPLMVLTVCLHRLLTDGGKGKAGAKRLSPRAGRAGGRCFVARVCMGRGQQLELGRAGTGTAARTGCSQHDDMTGWMGRRLPNLKCWITGNFSRHCEEKGRRGQVRAAWCPAKPRLAAQASDRPPGRLPCADAAGVRPGPRKWPSPRAAPKPLGKNRASHPFLTSPSHPKPPTPQQSGQALVRTGE